MEHMGVISEGEWSSLSGIYTAEEADFMAQLLHNSSLPNELCGASSLGVPSSTYWPGHELSLNVEGLSESSYYSSNMATSNFYNFSQGSRSSQHGYYLSDSHPILSPNNNSMSRNFCMMDMKNTGSFPIEGDDCLNQEKSGGSAEEYSAGNVSTAVLPDEKDSQVSRETEMPIPESESVPEEKSNPPENSKKRSRSSGDIQKNKKPLKKKQKANKNEEDSNAGLNGQSTSSYSSDDDCNASQELNGGVSSSLSPKGNASLNSNGKTRASRGSATDPQSLYARKRRERINERLRILQNLVPNGTKVDISTMLEEAVQYVKFLQLQIKLLSSHDLWMYAPLAYNGMDIGLDLKIIPPRQ